LIYKTAIIGCGRIGSLLEEDPLRGKPCTHAGAFGADPAFRLVAGCDLDNDRLQRFAKRWQLSDTHLYTDYNKLLSEEKPDVVSIATWTGTHGEITEAAARAGVRLIYCEKPLELSPKRARQMVELCRQHGIHLVVNHDRRWSWPYRAACKLLRSGELGEVRTVIGNVLTGTPLPDWHSDPARAGHGPLMHDGTHLVDAIRFLLGEDFASVRGRICRDDNASVEHTSYAWFTMNSGATGFLEAGGQRGYFNFSIDIQLSRGRILVGNGFQRLFVPRPSRMYSGFQDLIEVPFPDGDRQQRYHRATMEFAKVLAGSQGTKLSSTGADGLAVLEVINAIYESAEAGGKLVRVIGN